MTIIRRRGRILPLLLTVALILTLFVVFTPTASADQGPVGYSGGWEYTVDEGGNATITGYTGNKDAVLLVPAEIDGYPVTTYGNGSTIVARFANTGCVIL